MDIIPKKENKNFKAENNKNALLEGGSGNTPLISVIVPVYNSEKYIEKCIKSIQNQIYKNLQIIIIDDGSSDLSGKKCDDFAENDSRILVIHKQNEGQAKARNIGLDHAEGKYIGFVDSDDYILPNMYSSLYTLMTKYNAQIACCRIECTDSKGKHSYFNDNKDESVEVLSKSKALRELLYNVRVTNSLCDKLFSQTIFEDVRMVEGMIYEDIEVMHRCIAKAQRIVCTPEVFYCNFLSDESTTRTKFTEKQFDSITASELRTEFYKKNSPENYKFAQASHMTLCFDFLYKSRTNQELYKKRKWLVKEIRRYESENPDMPLSMHTKMKSQVLRLGLSVFDRIMSLFYFLSRK